MVPPVGCPTTSFAHDRSTAPPVSCLKPIELNRVVAGNEGRAHTRGSEQRRVSIVSPPYLPPRAQTKQTTKAAKSASSSNAEQRLECPVCCDLLVLPVQTRCNHIFCFFCLVHCTIVTCPVCREGISMRDGDFSRSAFSDLELKIYGDEKRRAKRLLQVAERLMQCRGAFITRCRLLKSDVGHHERHEFVVDALRSATRLLKVEGSRTAREQLERLLNGIVSCIAEEILRCTSRGGEEQNGGSEESRVRLSWSFGSAGVASLSSSGDAGGGVGGALPSASTSEQCEMFFCGGFMRRRAPSLLAITSHSSDDDDEDDGGRQRLHQAHHRNHRHNPISHRERLRLRLASTGVPPPQRANLPVLISQPDCEPGEEVTFQPTTNKLRMIDEDDAAVWAQTVVEDDGGELDDCAVESFVSGPPPSYHYTSHKTSNVLTSRFSLPGIRARKNQGTKHNNTDPPSSCAPPPFVVSSSNARRELMSADTRLQADLRAELKRASILAASRWAADKRKGR